MSVRMSPVLQLPDLKDAEAVQKFFLEEIQQGEELLAQGEASFPLWLLPVCAVVYSNCRFPQETMRRVWTT